MEKKTKEAGRIEEHREEQSVFNCLIMLLLSVEVDEKLVRWRERFVKRIEEEDRESNNRGKKRLACGMRTSPL